MRTEGVNINTVYICTISMIISATFASKLYLKFYLEDSGIARRGATWT